MKRNAKESNEFDPGRFTVYCQTSKFYSMLFRCIEFHVYSLAGSSVSVIVNLDITIAVISSAAVTVIYTLVGQMISVAYTDVVELLFIILGLVSTT